MLEIKAKSTKSVRQGGCWDLVIAIIVVVVVITATTKSHSSIVGVGDLRSTVQTPHMVSIEQPTAFHTHLLQFNKSNVPVPTGVCN